MNHVMVPQAFLKVGLSFATVQLFVNQTLKSERRFYLPQEPLGASLRKFWSEEGFPECLTVSSRFLEKILDAKLGGTVAQVVTRGFETWPILRQPVTPTQSHSPPRRQEPLASQELIFGLSERINSKGEVLQSLQIEELEFIKEKLKLMGVKRVCVNLLFSHLNSTHERLVVDYFREQSFEVFAAPRSSTTGDEMPSWRKNVINACLSGAFSEHAEEVRKSFGDQTVDFKFLDIQGNRFIEEKDNIVGSLFGWLQPLKETYSSRADFFIDLDLEKWTLIDLKNHQNFWKSPWGEIEVEVPIHSLLALQPTQEIIHGSRGGIDFSKEELGFEPGPISFGRAHKATLFDVLQNHFQFSDLTQIQKNGVQRFQDQIHALRKNNSRLENQSVPQITRRLVEMAVQRLGIDLQFSIPRGSRVAVSGYFARHILPLLKNEIANIRWVEIS